MAQNKKTPANKLGRGLATLMESTQKATTASSGLRHLPVAFMKPGAFQPRRTFQPRALKELADSIAEKGILQPLIVRPTDSKAPTPRYEIVAGERRWRAAQKVQLHNVPAIIMELNDAQCLAVALIENLQRSELTPLEEAQGYENLAIKFGYTQEKIASLTSKSRSHVANMMRLLTLPRAVQKLLENESLSMGHARALVSVKNPHEIAKKVVREKLNVQQTEALARKDRHRETKAPQKNKNNKQSKDIHIANLETRLANAIGVKVEITYQEKSGGHLSMRYKNLEQLQEICNRLLD